MYSDIMFIDDSEPNRKAVETLKDTHNINLNVYQNSSKFKLSYFCTITRKALIVFLIRVMV